MSLYIASSSLRTDTLLSEIAFILQDQIAGPNSSFPNGQIMQQRFCTSSKCTSQLQRRQFNFQGNISIFTKGSFLFCLMLFSTLKGTVSQDISDFSKNFFKRSTPGIKAVVLQFQKLLRFFVCLFQFTYFKIIL